MPKKLKTGRMESTRRQEAEGPVHPFIAKVAAAAMKRSGHSLVFRKEPRTCHCGQAFEAMIGVIDGVDQRYSDECPACRRKTFEAEKQTQLLEELE